MNIFEHIAELTLTIKHLRSEIRELKEKVKRLEDQHELRNVQE